MGILPHLQYYQRCEPIISKLWVKSKFVLWQPRYYNLLTKTIIRRFTFLKCLFSWKLTGIFNLKKSSSSTIFRWCTFGKLYIAKFNYCSGRPKRLKRGFEIFLIDHYAGDIGDENIAGKHLKKLFYQCHPPYTRQVSSYGVLYL